MQAARNNLSMCVAPDELHCFAGSLSGEISTISIDEFCYLHSVQAHAGGIHALACHPTLPYVGAMSTDRAFSVWRIEEGGLLTLVLYRSVRSIPCSDDENWVPYIQSTSQALAFHPTERRLLTRTGAGGLLEIAFDDNGEHEIIQCRRLHGEEDLVQARYLDDDDLILTMANYGEVAVSRKGNILRSWRFGWHNVHWAEPLNGTDYLLASDTRQVIRLDMSGEKDPIVGPHMTRDDLEHVTYNRTSGKAYVAGFDSNVYRISIETCEPLEVVYKAPYKCRWVKTLERAPDTMILQCRNGGMHKVDLSKGIRTALLRETPEAIWSADSFADDMIVMGGEARAIYFLTERDFDEESRIPSYDVSRMPIDIEGDAHFKRLETHKKTGLVVAGRTDGQIWVGTRDGMRQLCTVELPVRDLCLHPDEPIAFIATEAGKIYKVDIKTGEFLDVFVSPIQEQIWAIAYNPERDLLGLAEREGFVHILSGSTFDFVATVPDVRRPKRMRWLDRDTLVWSRSVELHKFDMNSMRSDLYVREVGNTIEDFIWDADRRYLVALNYNCQLILCDYESGDFIDVTPEGMDYSKGLIWLPDKNGRYPLDFLCFGRGGTANLFRIHDEKILPLGPIAQDGWKARAGQPRNAA